MLSYIFVSRPVNRPGRSHGDGDGDCNRFQFQCYYWGPRGLSKDKGNH